MKRRPMVRCRCAVCRGDNYAHRALLIAAAICILLSGYFR